MISYEFFGISAKWAAKVEQVSGLAHLLAFFLAGIIHFFRVTIFLSIYLDSFRNTIIRGGFYFNTNNPYSLPFPFILPFCRNLLSTEFDRQKALR